MFRQPGSRTSIPGYNHSCSCLVDKARLRFKFTYLSLSMRGCQLGGKGERESELGTTCSWHQPKLHARNSAKFHVCKGVASTIRVRLVGQHWLFCHLYVLFYWLHDGYNGQILMGWTIAAFRVIWPVAIIITKEWEGNNENTSVYIMRYTTNRDMICNFVCTAGPVAGYSCFNSAA